MTDFTRDTHSYLHYRDQARQLKTKLDAVNARLKKHIRQAGTEDDKGNYILNLDESINTESGRYTGLMLQRRASEFMDTDKAQELIERKGLRDRVVHLEEVWDYEEIYVLYRDDLISEDELNSIMGINETWALVPLED